MTATAAPAPCTPRYRTFRMRLPRPSHRPGAAVGTSANPREAPRRPMSAPSPALSNHCSQPRHHARGSLQGERGVCRHRTAGGHRSAVSRSEAVFMGPAGTTAGQVATIASPYHQVFHVRRNPSRPTAATGCGVLHMTAAASKRDVLIEASAQRTSHQGDIQVGAVKQDSTTSSAGQKREYQPIYPQPWLSFRQCQRLESFARRRRGRSPPGDAVLFCGLGVRRWIDPELTPHVGKSDWIGEAPVSDHPPQSD